jgi:hypothetical protein
MIHYMYSGKVSNDYDRKKDALPLLTIAHKYQIKPLIDFNEQILVERFVKYFHTMGIGNVPESFREK